MLDVSVAEVKSRHTPSYTLNVHFFKVRDNNIGDHKD